MYLVIRLAGYTHLTYCHRLKVSIAQGKPRGSPTPFNVWSPTLFFALALCQCEVQGAIYLQMWIAVHILKVHNTSDAVSLGWEVVEYIIPHLLVLFMFQYTLISVYLFVWLHITFIVFMTTYWCIHYIMEMLQTHMRSQFNMHDRTVCFLSDSYILL